MENNEITQIENHKTRRQFAKNAQKKDEISIPIKQVVYLKDAEGKYIKDENGKFKEDKPKIIGYKKSSAYKQRLNKEKYNFTKWFERINRAIEFGKKVHLINEENNYNNYVKWFEDQEIKYNQFLNKIYGEEKAKIIYDKYLQKIEKRSKKKYGF